MYSGETPIILEKIKKENCWFKKQLENWDELVRWIEVTPQTALKFITVPGVLYPILQQQYQCIVHFKSWQHTTGLNEYMEKYFYYWLNVPTEE